MSQHNELLRYVVIDSDYETETLRDISRNETSIKERSVNEKPIKERSINERRTNDMLAGHASTYQDIQQAYLIRQGDKENMEARKEQEGLEEQCRALQSMINLMIKEEAKLKVALRARQRKINVENNRKAQPIEQMATPQMTIPQMNTPQMNTPQMNTPAIQECRSPVLQDVNANASNAGKAINEWQSAKQGEKPKVSGGVRAKQRENGIAEGKVAKGRWTYQRK